MVYVDLSNSVVFGDKKYVVDSGSGFNRKIIYEGLVDNVFYKMSTQRDGGGLIPRDKLIVTITAINLLTGRKYETVDVCETTYDGISMNICNFDEYHDTIRDTLKTVIQEPKLSEATEESLSRLSNITLPDWVVPPDKNYRQK